MLAGLYVDHRMHAGLEVDHRMLAGFDVDHRMLVGLDEDHRRLAGFNHRVLDCRSMLLEVSVFMGERSLWLKCVLSINKA